jgi:methionyl aminopeptidase
MIIIKTEEELVKMRKAGKIVASVLKVLNRNISIGVTTGQLEDLAIKFIASFNAESAFKGYNGYPAHICTSINEEVVHGIPGNRALKNGDIISVDVGVRFEGYCADAAMTYCVGRVDRRIIRLVKVTRKALALAIQQVKPGKMISDISHAIESFVVSQGLSVVKEFVGHGIGKNLHEEPQIPNFGLPNQGAQLQPGMVLAIEPMVNMGTAFVEILADGWTAVTKDKQPSAHFEHTVLVTERGSQVITN